MKSQTWRDSARPIIHRVLKETEGKDEKEIRKALKEAYPFGERRYHPYKVWCDEIRVQMGKRRFGAIHHPDTNNPNQLTLI
jgi:hypothetical protein